jgi:uncharacterized coiled-coil DUF342 family protein
LIGLKSNLKSTPKHSIEVAKLNMKFKKSASKLTSKNIDVKEYESRLSKYRDSMRSCLYEMHKSKKELKNSIKASKEAINSKIAEMKETYNSIKADLKAMFREMDSQYRAFSKAV